MSTNVVYSNEPKNKQKFTEEFNKFYTGFASTYDIVTKIFTFWRRWINSAIPHIKGPRVLEVSFGTGYLLKQYAAQYDTYGIDYNEKFVTLLKEQLNKQGVLADIRQGDVQALPYEDEYFDSIVNTMAFSAYPDGIKAMSEMRRVLKPGGKLILVDIEYPRNRNWLGMKATKTWIAMGDIIREMQPMFERFGFEYTEEEIGGFGSVHLYVAEKLKNS
ncbi:MAG: class I SAM-dependent methyltransferase [Candidatus Marinimicrobia bacterium]|nr:class I SAM-dependent methyltransferase [Candidatus Neomarinimicrobiota bacterium]